MTSPTSSLRCSACASEMKFIFFTRDYNRHISDETFNYEKCVHCGLISLRNVPDDLGRYYDAGYHQFPATEFELTSRAENERFKLDIIRKFSVSGHLVEIGPSWGAFAYLAKNAGYMVEVIERDAACCRFIEERIGVRAIQTQDEANALGALTNPTIITLWHVIEHLRDPWRLLARAADRLALGGILIVSSPNAEAFQLRLFAQYWPHVDAPRHLHLIPPSLLVEQAKSIGLTLEFFTTTDVGTIACNEFGWRGSLQNMVVSRMAKRIMDRIGQVASTFAKPFERREGMGSAYTVVFKKVSSGRP